MAPTGRDIRVKATQQRQTTAAWPRSIAGAVYPTLPQEGHEAAIDPDLLHQTRQAGANYQRLRSNTLTQHAGQRDDNRDRGLKAIDTWSKPQQREIEHEKGLKALLAWQSQHKHETHKPRGDRTLAAWQRANTGDDHIEGEAFVPAFHPLPRTKRVQAASNTLKEVGNVQRRPLQDFGQRSADQASERRRGTASPDVVEDEDEDDGRIVLWRPADDEIQA